MQFTHHPSADQDREVIFIHVHKCSFVRLFIRLTFIVVVVFIFIVVLFLIEAYMGEQYIRVAIDKYLTIRFN